MSKPRADKHQDRPTLPTIPLTVDPDIIVIGEATLEQIEVLGRMQPPEPVSFDITGMEIKWRNDPGRRGTKS